MANATAVNEELVAKLESEIVMEESMKEDEDLSANIKEYLDNSPFEVRPFASLHMHGPMLTLPQIEDQPGNQEVVLTRTYNDEKIRITFTTADLNNNQTGDEFSDDNALFDDADMDVQSGGANTKGAINQGKTQDGNIRVAPEDRVAPADREELEDDYENDEQQQGFPAHATIRIERPSKGALVIEATAQDGDFLIEDLYYFPSGDLADPATAEKDWARRALYTVCGDGFKSRPSSNLQQGPPFNNLDEDLQILLEKYLEERGINTRLALFIPDYIDHKEQKEYVRWLNSTLPRCN